MALWETVAKGLTRPLAAPIIVLGGGLWYGTMNATVLTVNGVSQLIYGDDGNFIKRVPHARLPGTIIGGLTSVGFIVVTNRLLGPPSHMFPDLPPEKSAGLKTTVDYVQRSVKQLKGMPWKYHTTVIALSGVLAGAVSSSIHLASI